MFEKVLDYSYDMTLYPIDGTCVAYYVSRNGNVQPEIVVAEVAQDPEFYERLLKEAPALVNRSSRYTHGDRSESCVAGSESDPNLGSAAEPEPQLQHEEDEDEVQFFRHLDVVILFGPETTGDQAVRALQRSIRIIKRHGLIKNHGETLDNWWIKSYVSK